MQGMRELLRSSLGRSLRELGQEDRLQAAWPVACGSVLATHGVIDRLDEAGVVHVLVSSRDWMQSFLSMKAMLQNDLSKIASVPLSGIHFELKKY